MRIETWMVHEGINKNRQNFVKEELQVAAEDLFQEPNFGVMDFNHSVVFGDFFDEPKLIGVWHNAEFAFDESARGADGTAKGLWGIRASGVMFSWLFPEIADTIVADQARLGHLRVSMMAQTNRLEIDSDEDGQFSTLHDPTFLAVSVLDVAPADPDALGAGTEDPTVSSEDLLERIAAPSTATASEHTTVRWTWDSGTFRLIASEEDDMSGALNDKLVEQLEEQKSKAVADLATITEKYTQQGTKIETLEAQILALTDAGEEAATKQAEIEGVRDAVVTERDSLKESNKTLTTKVTELEAKIAEFEAAEEERSQQARVATRLAELPESLRRIHSERADDVRERLEGMWAKKTDEEWATYKKEELLAFVNTEDSVDYKSLSDQEGTVMTASADTGKGSISSRIAALSNNS